MAEDKVPAWMKGFADIGKPKPGGFLDRLGAPKAASSSLDRPQGAPRNPRFRPQPLAPVARGRGPGEPADTAGEHDWARRQKEVAEYWEREEAETKRAQDRAAAASRAARAKGQQF